MEKIVANDSRCSSLASPIFSLMSSVCAPSFFSPVSTLVLKAAIMFSNRIYPSCTAPPSLLQDRNFLSLSRLLWISRGSGWLYFQFIPNALTSVVSRWFLPSNPQEMIVKNLRTMVSYQLIFAIAFLPAFFYVDESRPLHVDYFLGNRFLPTGWMSELSACAFFSFADGCDEFHSFSW